MQVVGGDLDDPASLAQALRGIGGVFSVQNFYEKNVGYDGEIRQGRALADAAKAEGVTHYVQSTMAETPDPGDVHHFKSKFEVERYVRSIQLPATMIGTVWFMDNMLNPKMGGPMTFPGLAGTLHKDTPLHMLAVDDLGAAVARVFAEPETNLGVKHNLAGDVMTVPEMKATYQRVTGKRPKDWGMPNLMLRLFARDFAAQLRWHNRVNWSFSTAELSALVPKITTLADYLKKNDVQGL
jgi:uncharacterized protein YbjT (DUF2867 family)